MKDLPEPSAGAPIDSRLIFAVTMDGPAWHVANNVILQDDLCVIFSTHFG
ncbi:MAG: hypothetical protein JO327_01520 [Nitrososphaeraceae archaeon]|nr:hypothetical protein [Nitrososphaeraceae archaeon]MBV9666788.1 hypothetical protein [Nitrososphaeraceae archaeon]